MRFTCQPLLMPIGNDRTVEAANFPAAAELYVRTFHPGLPELETLDVRVELVDGAVPLETFRVGIIDGEAYAGLIGMTARPERLSDMAYNDNVGL